MSSWIDQPRRFTNPALASDTRVLLATMPYAAKRVLLRNNFLNLEAIQLHNTPVLVDGDDFYYHFLTRNLKHMIYGGEYLRSVLDYKALLSTMQQCQLSPMFILPTHYELRGQQFLYRLEGIRKHSSVLSALSDRRLTTSVHQLEFVFTDSVLVELLDRENIAHLRSPYCPRRSCAVLAAALKCPLFASSEEYLVSCARAPSRRHDGFAFVPFDFINFNACEPFNGCSSSCDPPCPNFKSGHCRFVCAHRFAPEVSDLRNVHEFYRPLLFPLLGTDTIPKIGLPSNVYTMANQYPGDSKMRRWMALCTWLSTFDSRNPMQPINQLISVYPKQDRFIVRRKLTESVLTYVPSPACGFRLASLLNETALSQCWQSRVRRILETRLTEKTTVAFDMQQILSGNDFDAAVTEDFTSEWPVDLTKAFIQSAVCARYIAPVGASQDVILPVHASSLHATTSVYEASLPLRLLHYRLFSGLSRQPAAPNVNEYFNIGLKVICQSIPVTPLYLDAERERADAILSQYLGLLITADLANCGPLVNLSIALAIWHYRFETEPSCSSPALTESPLALAVLVCALVTSFNYQHAGSNETIICEHYETVADLAERQLSPETSAVVSPPHISPTYRLEHVHAYNSLQLVYSSFRSLVSLINALVSTQNKSILPSFTNTWIIFPSGRLVHGIAACLALVPESTRRYQTIRFWMPRLLCRSPPSVGANPAQILREMSQEFDKLLDIASSILPDRVPSLHVSYEKRCVNPLDYGNLSAVVSFSPITEDSSSLKRTVSESLVTPKMSGILDSNVPNNSHRKENKTDHHPERLYNSVPKIMHPNCDSKLTRGRNQRHATGYAARLRERLSKAEANLNNM